MSSSLQLWTGNPRGSTCVNDMERLRNSIRCQASSGPRRTATRLRLRSTTMPTCLHRPLEAHPRPPSVDPILLTYHCALPLPLSSHHSAPPSQCQFPLVLQLASRLWKWRVTRQRPHHGDQSTKILEMGTTQVVLTSRFPPMTIMMGSEMMGHVLHRDHHRTTDHHRLTVLLPLPLRRGTLLIAGVLARVQHHQVGISPTNRP